MAKEPSLAGSCLCGGVRYEISGRLGHASHCHCSMCRKHHGAAFGSYASVRRRDFRWASGEALVGRFASSPGIERGFCTRCGSTLFWDATGDPTSFGLALGTLDADPGVRPSLHIFVGSKAPWYEIADGLPQHETSPRAAAAKPA
jgi:hypothetical protein